MNRRSALLATALAAGSPWAQVPKLDDLVKSAAVALPGAAGAGSSDPKMRLMGGQSLDFDDYMTMKSLDDCSSCSAWR